MTFLDHAKHTILLAWPMILSQGLSLIAIVIDTVMVGRAGGDELAYLSAGRSLVFIAMTVGIGLLSGIVVFTARLDGAGETAVCGRIWRSGMVYGAVLGLLAVIIVSIGGPLVLAAFGLAPDLVDGGGRYLAIMGLSVPGTYLLIGCNFFLQGLSRPKPGMVIMLVMTPLTVLLNWFLIYGNGGFPALGAAGAALATALTQWGGALATMLYILLNQNLRRYGVIGAWSGAWDDGRQLRRFGYPLGVASGLEFLGMTLLIMFAGMMGMVAISAFEIVLNMHLLAFIAAFGMATATSVRVGNAVGRHDYRSLPLVGLSGVVVGVLGVLPFVILYAVTPGPFFAIFTADAAIQAMAAAMLPFLVVAIALDGVQFVLLHSLRAAGDQLVASVLQVAGFMAVAVPSGWLFAFTLGMGGPGLTLGFLSGVVAAALFLGTRFHIVTRRLIARPIPA